MSERGVFAVDRGIWGHSLLASDDPFSRREAWIWLISEAAWKPFRRRIAGNTIDLNRGQLAASLRFIADKWGWSDGKVRRFLKDLKNDAMIDAANDAGITVITICKYDEYQKVSLPRDAANDAGDDAATTQERRKEESIKNIKLDTAVASAREASKSDTADPLPHWQAWLQVAEAMGADIDDPRWFSQHYRVATWIEQWDLQADILPTIRRLTEHRNKRSRSPPTTLAYFEQAIADAYATRNAPIPAGTPEAQNGKANGQRRGVNEAADAMLAAGISFGPRPKLIPDSISRPGANPVRLLSKG